MDLHGPIGVPEARGRVALAALIQARSARALLGALAELAQLLDLSLMQVRVPLRAVFGAAAALGLLALAVYMSAGLTLIQGDSIGHLFIARRMIDSITPSFAGLGAIWLPLPHLLMLPTIWIDPMWHTGLSGSIVSWLAFSIGTLYVYRIVLALTRNGAAGILAAALFATNPNLLFMQATPMTEALAICLILMSTYHLVEFAQAGGVMQLVFSAAAVMGATLTRYECWMLVPAGAAVVALASWERHRRYAPSEGLTLAWGMLAAYGIVLWVIYNQVIFGDSLNFVHGFGTAGAFAKDLEAHGLLPYKHHPLLAAATFGWSVIDTAGVPLVGAGLLGFAALLTGRDRLSVKLAAVLPVSIFLFEVVSLTAGQSGMATPQSTPATFENVRYGLLVLPAVAITAGALARPFRAAGLLLLAVALLPQLIALPAIRNVNAYARTEIQGQDRQEMATRWARANVPVLHGDQPAVVIDAVLVGGFSDREREPARWLSDHAVQGEILLSTTINDAADLILQSGLPVSRFIYEGNKPYFPDELHAFGTHADWIVFLPLSPNDALAPLMARADPPGFQLVFDSIDYQIFKRMTVDDFTKPAGVPDSAGQVTEDRVLGTTTAAANVPVDLRHVFTSLSCKDGLAILTTSREVLYADLACTPDLGGGDALTQLIGQPVAITVLRAGRTVRVEAADGSRLEFAPRRLWMDMHSDKPIPSAALLIRQDVTLGSVLPSQVGPLPRALQAVDCRDEVLEVTTDREHLFAEFHCPDLPPVQQFVGRTVEIGVTTGKTRAIEMRAEGSDAIRLETGRAWIEPLRPAAVPDSAHLVQHDLESAAGSPGTPPALFYALRCHDGVAALATTREIYYALYPCERLPSDQAFLTRPVDVQVTVGGTSRIEVRSPGTGTLDLEADAVWFRLRESP